MKTSKTHKKIKCKTCFTLMLLVSCSVFTGCTHLAEKMPLNDTPTALDTNFGWAVKRMKEIQQRPMVGYGPVAGYELEGDEAEKIMTTFDNRE